MNSHVPRIVSFLLLTCVFLQPVACWGLDYQLWLCSGSGKGGMWQLVSWLSHSQAWHCLCVLTSVRTKYLSFLWSPEGSPAVPGASYLYLCCPLDKVVQGLSLRAHSWLAPVDCFQHIQSVSKNNNKKKQQKQNLKKPHLLQLQGAQFILVCCKGCW